MKLTELPIGSQAIIVKNNAVEPIKSRLFAMGVVKGTEVVMKDYTLTKQTYDVCVGDTDVALRVEEAEQVEVSYENN